MHKKGYLLMEVIVAVWVFAIVVFGLMQGLNVGMLGTYRVDVGNRAQNLARSQMEYVKAQAYILYDDAGNPVEGQPYVTIDEIPPGFNISIAVSNIPDTNAEVLQHITVTAAHQSGARPVEMESYKINPAALPSLRDLPFVETVDIAVPRLPGTDEVDAYRDGTCDDGRFLLFHGYPYIFEMPREGAVAVTWVIDESGTYGAENAMDVFLYRNADFPNGDGRPDGPFYSEEYDYNWDTTCDECSGPYYQCTDCTKGKNWKGDVNPNRPRIVLMDDPNCYMQDARYCHDAELPGWAPPGKEPGWIAHEELIWETDLDKGNVLTTILTGSETVPAGMYTLFFYNSNPIRSDGGCFSGCPQYCTTPRVFTVATEWATVSFYSAAP